MVLVVYTCSCGAVKKVKMPETEINSSEVDLNIGGSRCASCNKWGTYTGTIVIDGITCRKAIVPTPYHGATLEMESFVNDKGQFIENPLPAETQKRFEANWDVALRKMQKNRREAEHPVAHQKASVVKSETKGIQQPHP
jgi:hypothetical protein